MAFQFLCPQGHLLQADESQVGQQMQCPYCGGMFLVPQPLPTAAPDPSPPAPPAFPEVGPQAPPAQSPAQPPFFQTPDAPAPSHEQPPIGPPPSPSPATEPPSFPPFDVAPPSFQPPDAEAAAFQPPAAGAEPETQAPDFPGIQTEPQGGQSPAAAGVPSEFKVPTAADLPIVHVVCPNGHSLETPQEMLGREALCPFCQVQFRLRLEDSVEYRGEKAKEQKRREIRAGQLWLRWAIAAAVAVVFGLILLMFL